jgi:hypothetical protein
VDGSMTVATPGARMRNRDPKSSESKEARRSPAFLAEMRPAVGVNRHDHRVREGERIVSLVSMVR